jgi:hypothetical protein
MKSLSFKWIVAGISVIAGLLLCAAALVDITHISKSNQFMSSYARSVFRVRHPRSVYQSYRLLSEEGNNCTYRIFFKGGYTGRPYHMDVTLQYNRFGILDGMHFGEDTCPVDPAKTVGFIGRMWKKRGPMLFADLVKMLPLLAADKPAPLTVADMSFKKASGKFKYKSEDQNDAQQGWKLSAEVPTSHSSFDTIKSFNIRGRLSGDSDRLNQTIWKDPTGIKGRNRDRYKQKFLYYTYSKSSGHHYPKYGLFMARIKDGKMRYNYAITKANEGNKLIAMDQYDYVKEYMDTNKVYRDTVYFDTALDMTSTGGSKEYHGGGAGFSYTAKKKGARGKIVQ